MEVYMHTFKLPGQQISQPPLQQWCDPPHEEQPHSPARCPEATTWTLAHRTLIKTKTENHNEIKLLDAKMTTCSTAFCGKLTYPFCGH